jgi:hypothetical protein
MDVEQDVAGLNDELVEDAMDLAAIAERVLQLPVRLVSEIITIPQGTDPPPLLVAVSEWALLYRDISGCLSVFGFEDKGKLSECLADVYRTSEIVAVLCKGKPVRFNMRVSARIG